MTHAGKIGDVLTCVKAKFVCIFLWWGDSNSFLHGYDALTTETAARHRWNTTFD